MQGSDATKVFCFCTSPYFSFLLALLLALGCLPSMDTGSERCLDISHVP